ncbi:hypothetical protein KTS45_14755 [Halomicroarcula limicola]|uniref:Asparagine synthase n=1 Tax=Haloarcula limicola TaxID=1429915 RepID=A0A8J8C9G9_9EURY|nr:hypothetical protein [Halomicroarcula limicola]MBV0925465.1 hypothetical protein [Halomicroarcula limicola]
MVDVSIHLDEANPWVVHDGTYARGTAFVDDERHDAADLAARFGSTESKAEFRSALDDLNGYYAVVHRTSDEVYAAVDRDQSMPLYYGWADGSLYLGDDAHWIREQLGERPRDPLAEAEFQVTGYVTGGETLYPDLRQLQAGELLAVGDGRDTATRERYYRYQPSGSASGSEAEFLEQLDDVLVEAFERAIDFADGRTIVVPLSGGYDSRLIVLMLDYLGYDDVMAFSYGKSWDSEHKVSKKIANEVGIPWEYVEYTNDKWDDWFNSRRREDYYDFSYNFGALPGWANLAWPSVWELKKQGRIPDDAVFMPGHTAVSPSEHFPNNILETDRVGREKVVEFLTNVNYKLWDWDDERFDSMLDDRILREVGTDEYDDPDDAAKAIAEWYWQERQAKFITRDVDVYEFWGHEWWMPLWDQEFASVWQDIPLEYREDKALYRRYVENLYTEHTGVELGQAQETEMSSPIRRAHQWLYHSSLFDVVRPLYARGRYYMDPRGWPGAMSRKQFASLFTGRQRAFSFFGLEALDKMSFDPPANIDTPTDGKITIDWDAADSEPEPGEERRQRGRTTDREFPIEVS